MYIGRYGMIDFPEVEYDSTKEAISYLRRLRKWVDDNRASVCDFKEVQNEIDTLLGLFDSTIYKLRFLS
jgi:hypothetical protein